MTPTAPASDATLYTLLAAPLISPADRQTILSITQKLVAEISSLIISDFGQQTLLD